MTPEVAVILGLSVLTAVLLLGAFYATTRQDRRTSAPGSSGETTTAPAGTVRPPRSADSSPPPPGPEASGHVGIDYPDPRTIKVGDTIDHQGVRARVLGAMHLSRQGVQWTEYLLDDGTRRRQWLSVEMHPGRAPGDAPHLEVLLWTPVPSEGMVPAKAMIIVEGVEFFPADRGTAAFRSEGFTGMPDRGLLDFADYRAADGRLLSFERVQGEGWNSSYARSLPPGSITILSRG
ncbi:DUF4178 domain-containing protein [Planomonospora parontospora]|uniref:DUF4178 domain-containing protein n=1 Tax=Planomonospora parontospora TaxID=58119 RepID=UPI0016714780|nr:DUF4178 domain-containing protein [Planomonospora parontospora]GGL10452.1 hypothetical protein GCM10014719_10480 [Planomonospora parontospora subsp. antibiotica]GII14762.1 hypothetical protein Ppa05_14880 [Planomonospora parontospora subsp. antibiotica]